MGLEPPIAGVLGYRRRRALDPLPVGGARDCWPPPALVVGVVEVVVVGDVGVLPVAARDEDEDDDHDALNPLPLCLGRPPVVHIKRHPLER